MHALALLVQSSPFDKQGIQPSYSSVQPSPPLTDQAVNTAFEQLLMSLHHVSALRAMRGKEIDLARVRRRARSGNQNLSGKPLLRRSSYCRASLRGKGGQ
jgi:hypothetical protein